MDILDEDLISFWSSLAESDVLYIMVGGFAVNMHGYLRATQDVDIWIKDEPANRENLGKAMKVFGYEDLDWEEMQFVPGWTNFYIGNGIGYPGKYERSGGLFIR